MLLILQIFVAVVAAQFARAVILGTIWHFRARVPRGSYWSKIQGVY